MHRPGQAALIVVLVVIVGLTVAVSILSRSVTTVTITRQDEEQARAFSAAEAGIEDALRQNLSTIVGSSPSFTVGPAGESSVAYTVGRLQAFSAPVDPGQVVTIDWTKSDAGTTGSKVDWDETGCDITMVATSITATGGVTHEVFLSSGVTVTRGTNTLTRLRFTGCQTTTVLEGLGGALSFYEVDSSGTSGDATSRVEVIRSEPSPIGLLDFAIFSGGSIN